MKARRTVLCTNVFSLQGGTEDNDLWAEVRTVGPGPDQIISTWVPTDEERKAIAEGENIQLVIHGGAQPPVSLLVSDVPLGKAEPGQQQVEYVIENVRHFIGNTVCRRCKRNVRQIAEMDSCPVGIQAHGMGCPVRDAVHHLTLGNEPGGDPNAN